MVDALNTSRFLTIKQCLGCNEKPVNYSDLSIFVLGRNDLSHFYSLEKDKNFAQIEAHRLGEDGYRVLL